MSHAHWTGTIYTISISCVIISYHACDLRHNHRVAVSKLCSKWYCRPFMHIGLLLVRLESNSPLACLDDIIIYALTFQDHLYNLDDVLSRLIAGGFELKLSKCILFKEKVRISGHVLSKSGVTCDAEKISAVFN